MLKNLRRQLLQTPEEEQAPKIREWCRQIPGVEQIADCRPRTRQKVAGVVESIKLTPQNNTCMLEVQIYDGTDEIVGVWYGRRKIPGVDLGRRIALEGTIADAGDSRDVELQIINPAYELLPA